MHNADNVISPFEMSERKEAEGTSAIFIHGMVTVHMLKDTAWIQ